MTYVAPASPSIVPDELFRLNLYPALAATGTVHAQYPTWGWVGVGQKLGDEITTPDKNGCRKDDCQASNQVTVRVPGPLSGDPIPGAQRIISLSLECTTHTSICDFNSQKSSAVSDNGTLGTINFNTWSHPTTWRVVAQVEEWKQTGYPKSDAPVTLSFNQQSQVNIPHETNIITMDIKSFTGNNYSLTLPGADPHQLVDFISRTPAGPSTDIVMLSAQPPANMR